MIKWDGITKGDIHLIKGVVDRAVARGPGLNRMDVEMDIAAAHLGCPLDLLKLLDADDFNFWYDVNGISRHLNRDTGELEGYFLPRCAHS